MFFTKTAIATIATMTVFATVSGASAQCVEDEGRELCKGRGVNLDFLTASNRPGVGCSVIEAVSDMRIDPEGTLVELSDQCRESDPKRNFPTPRKATKTVNERVMRCYNDKGHFVDLGLDEVVPEKDDAGYTNCIETMASYEKNVEECVEEDVDECVGDQINADLLDPALHNECAAVALRSEVAFDPPNVLQTWRERCALGDDDGGRRLDYRDDCGTYNLIIANTHYTWLFMIDSSNSFHWHFRNLRGLEFSPLIVTADTHACTSSTCTKSNTGSCWPRPMFTGGVQWRLFSQTTYSCGTQNAEFVHVFGNFRGSMEFVGSIKQIGSQNNCQHDVQDGIVTIYTQGTSLTLCDIHVWIEQTSNYILEQGQDFRNVCDGF